MGYKAIVSAHIYLDDEGKKDIEILSQIDNDDCEMFEGIRHSLLDMIEIGDSEDYYFMAIVQAETVVHRGFDYTEYDVEHYVKEIKSIEDINA